MKRLMIGPLAVAALFAVTYLAPWQGFAVLGVAGVVSAMMVLRSTTYPATLPAFLACTLGPLGAALTRYGAPSFPGPRFLLIPVVLPVLVLFAEKLRPLLKRKAFWSVLLYLAAGLVFALLLSHTPGWLPPVLVVASGLLGSLALHLGRARAAGVAGETSPRCVIEWNRHLRDAEHGPLLDFTLVEPIEDVMDPEGKEHMGWTTRVLCPPASKGAAAVLSAVNEIATTMQVSPANIEVRATGNHAAPQLTVIHRSVTVSGSIPWEPTGVDADRGAFEIGTYADGVR
ncbi:MAG: hypothetical protein ACOYBY_18510, partial [Dermatophilaceae bacterium]